MAGRPVQIALCEVNKGTVSVNRDSLPAALVCLYGRDVEVLSRYISLNGDRVNLYPIARGDGGLDV